LGSISFVWLVLCVILLAIVLSLTPGYGASPEAPQVGDLSGSPSSRQPTGILPLEHMTPERVWLGAGEGYSNARETTVERFGLGADGYAFGFVSRLCRDFVTQFQFPFRYAAKEPKRFLLGTAGLLALVFTDHKTLGVIAPQSPLRENGLIGPAEDLSNLASGSSIVALVAGFGALGILVDSPRERETSVMLVEAVLTSEVWADLLKMASRRERPRDVDGDMSDWEGPSIIFKSENPDAGSLKSFPSGHSAGTWAMATILAHQYPAHKIVPVLGYGTALAMSYSRMAVRAHWLSDVVVGGLIGYGCARQVLSAHRSARAPEEESEIRFGIDASPDYMGVGLQYDF